MTKPHHEHGHAAHGNGSDTDGHRIEDAADEIFSRAQDTVREVAGRATHLAEDTLERGRAGILRVERASRGEDHGRVAASPFATALAVGAMGYAIATLIQGAVATRHTRTEKPSTLPPA
jgi:hypothetical protein